MILISPGNGENPPGFRIRLGLPMPKSGIPGIIPGNLASGPG